MKSAMVVTWACLTVLLLLIGGVASSQKSKPAHPELWTHVCEDGRHILTFGQESVCEEESDQAEADQPPIVWIVNHDPETIFYNTDTRHFEFANGQPVPLSRLETLHDYPQTNNTVCLPEHQCGQEPLVYASDVAPCLTQMEAAMRAMDKYIPPFVDPVERRRAKEYGDGIIMDDLVCRGWWCGGGVTFHDTRSIEERLADDRRRYEREQEELGRQLVEDQRERFAYQQWAMVKRECWRQP